VRRRLRVDPQVVIVAVGLTAAERAQGLATVGRAIGADVEQIDEILVLRIRGDVRVVKRALADVPVFVDQRPGGAGVVADEQPALFVFDQRVDAI